MAAYYQLLNREQHSDGSCTASYLSTALVLIMNMNAYALYLFVFILSNTVPNLRA